MKHITLVLGGIIAVALSGQEAWATAFMTDSASVALNDKKDSLVLNVFHHKADGIRCGVRLVASDPGVDISKMASRLEITQDDRPLAPKFSTEAQAEDKEVSYSFTREVMFISKVEIKTKSGKPLAEELKSSKVSVAAQDCEPARGDGPVMVAGDR